MTRVGGALQKMSSKDMTDGVRWEVFLPALMRSEGPPAQVTILNVSTSGLMLSIGGPLREGSYVEVVRRSTSIVGRVVWVQDCRAGIMSRDRIDLHTLLSPEELKQAANLAGDPRIGRRAADPAASTQEAAARSTRLGQVLQFTPVTVVLAIAGVILALIAYHALHTALFQIESALGRHA
jgi:hypothetical protein